MTRVPVKQSLSYGGAFFGYVLAVVVVGGGGLVLGGLLAEPELSTLLGEMSLNGVDTAALTGGLVLAILGGAVVLIGTFALSYKLIADAVSTGMENGTSRSRASRPEAKPRTATPDMGGPDAEDRQTGSSSGRDRGEEGTDATGESKTAEDVFVTKSAEGDRETDEPEPEPESGSSERQIGSDDDASSDDGSGASEGETRRAERSAEEIAFGTTRDDDATEASGSGRGDEAAPTGGTTSGTGTDAAGGGDSDPLADPTSEDE